MLQDSAGTLWVGSYGETPALHYCNKGGHFHASDMAGIETVGYVSALCDYEGTLWIGTANGLFAFDYRLATDASCCYERRSPVVGTD